MRARKTLCAMQYLQRGHFPRGDESSTARTASLLSADNSTARFGQEQTATAVADFPRSREDRAWRPDGSVASLDGEESTEAGWRDPSLAVFLTGSAFTK